MSTRFTVPYYTSLTLLVSYAWYSCKLYECFTHQFSYCFMFYLIYFNGKFLNISLMNCEIILFIQQFIRRGGHMFKTELVFYFSLFFDFNNTWTSVALKRFPRESLKNRKTFKQIWLVVIITLGRYL